MRLSCFFSFYFFSASRCWFYPISLYSYFDYHSTRFSIQHSNSNTIYCNVVWWVQFHGVVVVVVVVFPLSSSLFLSLLSLSFVCIQNIVSCPLYGINIGFPFHGRDYSPFLDLFVDSIYDSVYWFYKDDNKDDENVRKKRTENVRACVKNDVWCWIKHVSLLLLLSIRLSEVVLIVVAVKMVRILRRIE